MKNIEVLVNKALMATVLVESAKSLRMDIATFGLGGGDGAFQMLHSFPPCRLIVGGFRPEDKSKVRAFATVLAKHKPSTDLRYCLGSHVKLFVFHSDEPCAIVGSQNLGFGSTYEAGVLVRGRACIEFKRTFDSLWAYSVPVKPLDLEAAKAALESGVFEVEGLKT